MLPEPSYPGSILFRGIAHERRDEFVDIDLPPLEDDDDDVEFDDDLPPLEDVSVRFETCFICQIENVVYAKIDFTSDIYTYQATNTPQWVCESCRRNVYNLIHDMFPPGSIEIYCAGIGDIEIDVYISLL